MSKPTKDDAQLFIQILGIIIQNKNLGDAMSWVATELNEKTFEEFRENHPIGSEGCKKFSAFVGFFETIGVLVNRGLLSEDLIYDAWGDLHWEKIEAIVHGRREETQLPRQYENYEVMAKGYPEWAEKNPLKL